MAWRDNHIEDESGCWIWQGARLPSGYGLKRRSGAPRTESPTTAHRAYYERYVGTIPEGLTLDHLCRNRSCVNPAHLEPVTIGENVRRSPIGNAAKTHCPRGHKYDGVKGVRRERYCKRCALDQQRELRARKKVRGSRKSPS